MHEPDRDSERRDWTKLPPDLAAEIAGRLLGVDLTEYIRFRSVCKPWRQSTEDPRGGLHSRFIPRNWVVPVNYLDRFRCNYVYGEDARKFRLLNVATGASLTHVEFPGELSGHRGMGYAEGLLVLWNKAASVVRLLNPLTHAVTDLPDFSSVVSEASPAALDGGAYQFRGFGVIDGGAGAAGTSPPTIVFFLDGEVPVIACIRLGEPRWALVDTSELDRGISFSSALSLRGRFYMATSAGDVLAVELHPKPRLVHVIRRATAATKPTATAPPATTTTRPFFEFFLVPSGNDHGAGMLMVRASRVRQQVEVFEVDVDEGKLVPSSTVGADRAVFIGSTRALSISTRLFPSIAANAVYFCTGSRSMDLLFYIVHLDTGWGEPARLPFSDQGPFVDPCNLDVYLAWSIDTLQVLAM
ncbi:hypothetical protein PVAP13_1KG406000 [Panicum virgatum]|uniref:KIB1-4 beta-propeller domain-containing protein n=1 Tax=Panicum virgatum TaxID=38727 RepID=A0A8T0XKW1_PANVG|nr:hypothetical protein PVAP13_1KG406000 [Panicum virgatum]